MSSPRVLVTGAGGYLGDRVARWILARTGATVVLGMREIDDARPGLDRAEAIRLDVSADEDWERLAPDFTHVVHAAAVTRFKVDRETAERVNVAGTRRAIGFAERCPKLESFTLLSTLYVSGLEPGPMAEALVPEPGAFANHYEWSKWSAEHALGARRDFPGRIVRVATVIADDDSGRVVQHNVIHNTLRLFHSGLLGLLPGSPQVPLYFITGDVATSAIGALVFDAAAAGVYHVSPGTPEAITIEQTIDAALEAFAADESFRRRRVERPLLVDREAFDALARSVSGFTGAVLHDAVSSVAPFAPQLYVRKEIDNRRWRAAQPGACVPPARAMVREACAWLVRTQWGRAQGSES